MPLIPMMTKTLRVYPENAIGGCGIARHLRHRVRPAMPPDAPLKKSFMFLRAFGVTALVVMLFSFSLSCGARSGKSYCIKPELLAERLIHISSLDWKKLNKDNIGEEWPNPPIFQRGQEPVVGMEQMASILKNCFNEKCDMCAILFSDRPGDAGGLSVISIYTREEAKPDAISHLHKLVAAAIPGPVLASYKKGWGGPDAEIERCYYTAKWQSYNDDFLLEAHTYTDNGKWGGVVNIIRVRPVKAIERWTLEDGSIIQIVQKEVKLNEQGEKELYLDYMTNGFLMDHDCRRHEIQLMWPQLKALIEKEKPLKVYLGIRDGADSFMGVSGPEKLPNGEWQMPEP